MVDLFEKVDDNSFKVLKVSEVSIQYNLKDLLSEKEDHENKIKELDALIAKAKELGL